MALQNYKSNSMGKIVFQQILNIEMGHPWARKTKLIQKITENESQT